MFSADPQVLYDDLKDYFKANPIDIIPVANVAAQALMLSNLKTDFEKLSATILANEDLRNVIYEETWFKEAIHLKWLFALILLLLSIEWFVRKRGGAY